MPPSLMDSLNTGVSGLFNTVNSAVSQIVPLAANVYTTKATLTAMRNQTTATDLQSQAAATALQIQRAQLAQINQQSPADLAPSFFGLPQSVILAALGVLAVLVFKKA